ncbi:MAG: bifunctional (p)ppGpp synthetase/guanosine-3',5'-bis(diphosphate) 3'-pyrophosphohydrolase [Chloroflexi bacterium]|nr:bifunctional (p)ppGpp synthetase/guanosine-3',5'-bis(diphosphate) 3'-pyrophosphohydrolase [Chloroflexota bacterium]MBP7045284.1 bifunctional (p)ppGpp synthetase/guanosine-3',5'-bis(diphosphate) 3'-pyrophosphohydrolase [Chloroflexota bacterium]
MTQLAITTLTELLDSLPEGMQKKAADPITRAYNFAQEAHSGERRQSGELYVDHDLFVAQVLIKLGVDTPTIVAGLLHDSLYAHTSKKEEDLRRAFGDETTGLVLGLNKLYAYAEQQNYKKYQSEDSNSAKLEAIRRAILTIIEGDIRVILIRMVDCLEDLRKASELDRVQQLAIATEAMNIYAPLANRLGVWQLKWELEDLAFRFLEPEKYREIAGMLAERRVGRAERIEQARERLEVKLAEMGLKAMVTGRPKHIYSIARKMDRKQVDFEQIFDVHALRVILEPSDKAAYALKSGKEKDEEDRILCYQVLGAVHSLWQPIPREFDDYIASPKANGYKSLHTAVIDNRSGQTLEVQIRTTRMHEEAEKGIAAHWAYKEDGARVTASVQKRIQNLRELLVTLREVGDSASDSEIFETEFLAERIYAFTPRGDVVDLPIGSTPIDFAYQIHTEVGHRCRGARVDGKMVSLDYKLKSGQRVEILTSKRGGPSRDWMNASLGYTGSARTRSKVRQWFRAQEREQNIEQGREVVERELKRLGLSDVYSVPDIAEALKYDDVDSFLARVGFGDIQSTQISGAIAILKQQLQPDDELRPLLQDPRSKPKGLTVRGLSGLYTKMAGCCNPIPPEKIVGYITRGQGVTIHRLDCKQVEAITEKERLIEVDWGGEEERFPIPIVVKAYRRPGLVDEMSSILRGQQITAPKTKTITNGSILTVNLVAEVTSLEQLNWLLQKFENLPNVIEAHRQRWT